MIGSHGILYFSNLRAVKKARTSSTIFSLDKLLDDENKSLKHYKLVDKAVLWIITNPMYYEAAKISISVSTPLHDQKVRLEVNPNDSVKSVEKTVADKLSIPKASLKFNGTCNSKSMG